jgi:flagellar FliJ protein
MKRFSFRLESVRALREQAEEQAKAVLGRELALEAECAAAVAAAADRLAQAAAAGAEGCGSDFAARQAYVERCERLLAAAQLELALAKNRVEDRRRALTEASREREMLDRLRTKHLAVHQAEASRAEEAMLSEVGLTMFRGRTA